MTLLDVIEATGPIMAHDAELGLVVTVNGAYLNLWVQRDGAWDNVDVRARPRDLCETTTAAALDEAAEWLAELVAEGIAGEP